MLSDYASMTTARLLRRHQTRKISSFSKYNLEYGVQRVNAMFQGTMDKRKIFYMTPSNWDTNPENLQ